MTSNIWYNVSGTTSNSFTIGKNGVTMFYGTVLPNSLIGSNGDMFFLQSSAPTVLQKVGGVWLNSSASEKSFSSASLSFGQTLDATPVTTYVGVTAAPLGGTDASTVETVVALPGGVVDGLAMTVKDEVGAAGTWQITVNCADGSLIDGQTALFITNNYGVLRLVSRSGKWFVSGGF